MCEHPVISCTWRWNGSGALDRKLFLTFHDISSLTRFEEMKKALSVWGVWWMRCMSVTRSSGPLFVFLRGPCPLRGPRIPRNFSAETWKKCPRWRTRWHASGWKKRKKKKGHRRTFAGPCGLGPLLHLQTGCVDMWRQCCFHYPVNLSVCVCGGGGHKQDPSEPMKPERWHSHDGLRFSFFCCSGCILSNNLSAQVLQLSGDPTQRDSLTNRRLWFWSNFPPLRLQGNKAKTKSKLK